ncbi:MAG: chitosanase [Burkholderiales bacterium]|nr:chitosanase [Burkholderiales bacterium]
MGISNRSKLTCVVPLLCAALIALAPQVASASSDEANAEKNFSPATLTFLQAKTGMDAEQWNNVMRLVNKSEQDDPSFSGWVKYYGYCQNIGDGRGITMAIQGATTGGPNDGGPDGPGLFLLFNKYNGAAKPSIAGGLSDAGVKAKMSGNILVIQESDSAFCKRINALENNAAWRAAVWESFYDNYIGYAVQQARDRNFNDALTIGAFTDAALNQGATGSGGSLQDMLSKSGHSSNELTFMTSFLKLREKVAGTNDFNNPPINGYNRAKMWLDLYTYSAYTLKNVDGEIQSVSSWTMH